MPKLKVLIIEDESQLAQALRMRLEMEGYEVFCLEDGLGAVVQAPNIKPDIMIVDFGLPGASGAVVYKRIRQQPATQTIPLSLTLKYRTFSPRTRSRMGTSKLRTATPGIRR